MRTAPSSPLLALLLLGALPACEGSTIKFGDTGDDLDEDTAVDTDTGADTDTGGDTGDTDTGTDTPPSHYEGEYAAADASAVLLAEGNSDGVGSAGTLASADVDGDGLGDLVVGARMAGSGGGFGGGGRVYVVANPPDGVTGLADAAATILTGETQNAMFGYQVAAGDVNEDGVGDVVVAAPAFETGAVRVFLGPLRAGEMDEGQADAVLIGESMGSYTGQRLEVGGDLDGDGRGDLLVGAMQGTDECRGCGAVYVNLTAGDRGDAGVADDSVTFYGANDRDVGVIGSSGTIRGDLDGDGHADLVIGTPQARTGGALIAYGPLAEGVYAVTDTDARFEDEAGGGYTGMTLATADVDGDGYDDLAVGAPYEQSAGAMSGRVYVQFGGGRWGGDRMLGDDVVLQGASYNYAGSSITDAGDLDGDGSHELLVGAPYAAGAANYAGKAFLVYGPLAAGTLDLADAPALFEGEHQQAYLGWASTGPGDLDGDGDLDLALGAMVAESPATGGVYVFRGEE